MPARLACNYKRFSPPPRVSWGRLDNIVGPTQDTRKGPNGRKLDAPGRPTDGTNAAHRSTGTPPIRYLANTGSLNHPYDASRIGTRPTPSQPPTASTACPSVRGAVVCCYTHYPASLQKAGHRVTATQQKSQDTSKIIFITILRIRRKGSRSPREIPPPRLRTSCTTTRGYGRIG